MQSTYQCSYSPYPPEACPYVGGTWNYYYGYCEQCYYTQPYYTGPQRGDVMHFEAGAATGVATVIQQLAFGATATKVHAAVCSSTGYGGCSQIWESTATMTIDDVFRGRDSCSSIESWSSNDLVNLNPGLRWAAALSTPYGTTTYFRPNDSAMVSSWESKSYTYKGPGYGGPYYYKVGAFTRYKPYGQCSESVSDGYAMTAWEGDGQVLLSYSQVQSILSSAESSIRDVCWDKIPSSAWWCWGQGGREGICHTIAHKTLNAFMDEPWRNGGEPQPRQVSGVTAPSQQYCFLAGACSPCQPQTCSSLGVSCGTWNNGCGGYVYCGECPEPDPVPCGPDGQLCYE